MKKDMNFSYVIALVILGKGVMLTAQEKIGLIG
jgi:hypothetical protein